MWKEISVGCNSVRWCSDWCRERRETFRTICSMASYRHLPREWPDGGPTKGIDVFSPGWVALMRAGGLFDLTDGLRKECSALFLDL